MLYINIVCMKNWTENPTLFNLRLLLLQSIVIFTCFFKNPYNLKIATFNLLKTNAKLYFVSTG